MHNLDQSIKLTAPDKCILLCSYEYKKYSSDMFWYKHTIFREDNIPGLKLIANDIFAGFQGQLPTTDLGNLQIISYHCQLVVNLVYFAP